MKWRDPVVRGLRTFVQAFLGVFIAITTSGAMKIDTIPDVDLLKRALWSAAWAGVVAVVSFTQNALETATGRSALK